MARVRQPWMCLITITCVYHYVTFAKDSFSEPKNFSAEERIRDDIFSGYSILQRPVSNLREPNTVFMSMGFATMHNFIEKEQILSSSAYMQLRWMDHRLTWDPADYDGIELIPVSPSEVWLPRLTVYNSVSGEGVNVVDEDVGQILLKFDGELNLGMVFQQSTQCTLNVIYFPFDKQACPFMFGFQNSPQSLGRLEVLGSYLLPYQTTSQWNVMSITGQVFELSVPNVTSTEKSANFSVAQFTIFLERDPSYYITTLIIPSVCLNLIAFMTFLAPPDSGERLSVSVSMVLGMTVFQLLMYDLLPISNEQSLLGNYLSSSFILVTLTVPLSLININIAYRDRSPSLLNKRWFRLLVLEYIPSTVLVTPLSQRISKRKISSAKVTPSYDGELSQESPELGEKVKENFSDRNIDGGEQMDKLESRILAVVSDRLTFILLLTFLIVKSVWLISDYSGQEEL